MNVKSTTVIRALVLFGFVNLWCSANYNAAAQSQPVWQTVAIANLPANCSLRSVWARNRNEAYVWAQRVVANSPQSFLFRWDGATWSQVLALTNYDSGKIFGTGSSDVFVSAEYYPGGFAGVGFARIFRSTDNGISWTEQTLPSLVAGSFLNFGSIGGTPNNVHVAVGDSPAYIVRFDGVSWNTVFTNSNIYGLTLVDPDEGYYVTCYGWGNWNGTDWQSRGSSDAGCDVYGGVWGMRDNQGELSMYATGQNGGNNGPHVWRFNESNSTWSQVFSDGTSGNGIGVWGSGPNDVYVVGELISGQTHSGRVYHFDGASWLEIADIGTIPRPGGIGGTAADDIWVSLGTAGTMLHYAPASSPALAISLDATNVVITWPDSAVGYRLESTSNLSPVATWSSVTNIVSLINNQYQVTLPITTGSQLFRLVNP